MWNAERRHSLHAQAPHALASTFQGTLTYGLNECIASRPRRCCGYCSGSVWRLPSKRVWLTRQAPRLNVFEHREDGGRPREAKWGLEEVS